MTFFKTISLFAVSLAFPLMGQAQDLMAREANTDFQLKSSATAKMVKQIQIKEEINYAAKIYGDNWTNAAVNSYKNMPKPEELVIDLRDFSMPIKSKVVTSKFGYRARFRRNHYGLDIDGFTGDTIYAAFAGKVRIRKYNAGGFGYYIVIRHNNGLETVYGHLSKQLVNENQEVKSGQPIGLCGNTGRSTGSHLHFETRVLGEAINPALLFDIPAQDVVSDTYTYRSPNSRSRAKTNNVVAQHEASRTQVQATSTTEEENSELAENTQTTKKESTKAVASKRASRTHKVKKGESLYSIARQYKMTVKELCKMNNITSKTRLMPGKVLSVN